MITSKASGLRALVRLVTSIIPASDHEFHLNQERFFKR
jgi:hypothetical protein